MGTLNFGEIPRARNRTTPGPRPKGLNIRENPIRYRCLGNDCNFGAYDPHLGGSIRLLARIFSIFAPKILSLCYNLALLNVFSFFICMIMIFRLAISILGYMSFIFNHVASILYPMMLISSGVAF